MEEEDKLVVTVKRDGDNFVVDVQGAVEQSKVVDALETAIVGLFAVAMNEGVMEEILRRISKKANIDLLKVRNLLINEINQDDDMVYRMFG